MRGRNIEGLSSSSMFDNQPAIVRVSATSCDGSVTSLYQTEDSTNAWPHSEFRPVDLHVHGSHILNNLAFTGSMHKSVHKAASGQGGIERTPSEEAAASRSLMQGGSDKKSPSGAVTQGGPPARELEGGPPLAPGFFAQQRPGNHEASSTSIFDSRALMGAFTIWLEKAKPDPDSEGDSWRRSLTELTRRASAHMGELSSFKRKTPLAQGNRKTKIRVSMGHMPRR